MRLYEGGMRTALFDFELPPDRIALRPVAPRDAARLLVVRPDGTPELEDRGVSDLADLLRRGDALVVNDTKVIAARLRGRRIGRGAMEPAIEATLHQRLDGSRWRAFVKPAKRLSPGDVVRFGDEGKVCFLGQLDATVEDKAEGGEVTLAFAFHGPVLDQAVDERGVMPLPPYIRRVPDERDRTDYQTMFAQTEGSVAAPTAGLHFTDALTSRLAARGITLHKVTLHVGAGTFLPVKAADTAAHRMHAERGSVTAQTGLPLPRGRRDDDEFPFAALDPVHAGGRVLRTRHDEAGLCPRDRRGLPVLLLRRRLPAVPALGSLRANGTARPLGKPMPLGLVFSSAMDYA